MTNLVPGVILLAKHKEIGIHNFVRMHSLERRDKLHEYRLTTLYRPTPELLPTMR